MQKTREASKLSHNKTTMLQTTLLRCPRCFLACACLLFFASFRGSILEGIKDHNFCSVQTLVENVLVPRRNRFSPDLQDSLFHWRETAARTFLELEPRKEAQAPRLCIGSQGPCRLSL